MKWLKSPAKPVRIRQREKTQRTRKWPLCNSPSPTQPPCSGLLYILREPSLGIEASLSKPLLLLPTTFPGAGDASSPKPPQYRFRFLTFRRGPKTRFRSGRECTSLSTPASCFSTSLLSPTTPTTVL